MSRFTDDVFNSAFISTIALIYFKVKNVKIKNNFFKFQICGYSGPETL
jgi:hypothetical protein